jgi:hypothetical protein
LSSHPKGAENQQCQQKYMSEPIQHLIACFSFLPIADPKNLNIITSSASTAVDQYKFAIYKLTYFQSSV